MLSDGTGPSWSRFRRLEQSGQQEIEFDQARVVCPNGAEQCPFGLRLRRLEQCGQQGSNLTKLAVNWEASFHQLLPVQWSRSAC